MTEVEFFTGVAEPLDFACRLVRKAYRKGARLFITAPPQTLRSLDRALWVFDEREFVPHIKIEQRPQADDIRRPPPEGVEQSGKATFAQGPLPAAAQRTPVWLSSGPRFEGAPDVLINLGAEAPTDLAGITRLIEIVSREVDEATRGRQRWRHYRELGLAIKHHGA